MTRPGPAEGARMSEQRDKELTDLRNDLAQTKEVIGTLIAWMVQSANSPIRGDEATRLIKMLVKS
jgi:hypothetical protein